VSELPQSRPRRERPRKKSRPGLRIVLVLVLLVLVFLLGIAFAQTLDERPEQGDLVTDVRTLTPLEQQPPARTVTVTVTTP
jgi:hypothetical protein